MSHTYKNILNKTKIQLETRISHSYVSNVKLPHYIDDMKVHRVFNPHSAQDYRVRKVFVRQICKVSYQARLDSRTRDLSLNKSLVAEHYAENSFERITQYVLWIFQVIIGGGEVATGPLNLNLKLRFCTGSMLRFIWQENSISYLSVFPENYIHFWIHEITQERYVIIVMIFFPVKIIISVFTVFILSLLAMLQFPIPHQN